MIKDDRNGFITFCLGVFFNNAPVPYELEQSTHDCDDTSSESSSDYEDIISDLKEPCRYDSSGTSDDSEEVPKKFQQGWSPFDRKS